MQRAVKHFDAEVTTNKRRVTSADRFGMTMADVKFYERGIVPGDFLVIDTLIQEHHEWAIVRDLTYRAGFISHVRPTWHVIVNGVFVRACPSRLDAEHEMRTYLEGRYWIPRQ